MRKIIASLFVSLDGVAEAPDTWHFPYFNDEMGAAISASMAGSDAMLLGRVQYQEFAAYWPSSQDDFADFMNNQKKYVVSTTLTEATWNNTEIIADQSAAMLELSTPVVRLWDGIIAVPLVGTLDSARTQLVMEKLLDTLVATGAGHAVIDITGVPTVDTEVAQHLLKTVSAARLLGAECTISGIRPQVAQTIVSLGIEFGDIATKATLADALALALGHSGLKVVPALWSGCRSSRSGKRCSSPSSWTFRTRASCACRRTSHRRTWTQQPTTSTTIFAVGASAT